MIKKIPTKLEQHGHVRVDDYYWLRERENPEVIQYLNDENDYAAKEMAHAHAFEEKLFEEIKGRFKQTDMSVPYKRRRLLLYTRYEEGRNIRSTGASAARWSSRRRLSSTLTRWPRGTSFFSRRWAVTRDRTS